MKTRIVIPIVLGALVAGTPALAADMTAAQKCAALEKQFDKEATAAGLDGLKGHRSVGGMRASIYNAFPEEGVTALVQFMREFERTRG